MKNIIKWFQKKKRESYLKKIRKMLRNKEFTLISNNCTAGVIYSDLGQRFDSPTINLFFKGWEYLTFVKNLKDYTTCPLIDISERENEKYPVGLLVPEGDKEPIKVFFMHYIDFEDACSAWKRRCQRINYNNLFFIWEFYDEIYDKRMIEEFDKLPIKKAILLHNKIAGLENSFCFSYKNETIGQLFEINKKTGKRYLDEFNYLEFINN